jgi:hypothetical protein
MSGSTPGDENRSAGESRTGSGFTRDALPESTGDTPSAPVGHTRPGTSGEQRVCSPAETRSARLNVAALRRAVPIRMWGGKGSGLPCDFCRVLVGPEDVEYEVEAQLDGATVMLRFHYRCHYAWTGGEEPLVATDRA